MIMYRSRGSVLSQGNVCLHDMGDIFLEKIMN